MANSKRKCRECKDYALVSEGHVLFNVYYCSEKCIRDYAKKNISKGRKIEAKEAKKDLLDLNRSSRKWQLALTQKAFNKMRVLEDILWYKKRGLTPICISCAKPDGDWCCGHYKTVGSNSNLRFDRKNTNLQCGAYCNVRLSGNIVGTNWTRGYKVGIIERFGKRKGGEILAYCEENIGTKKWEITELESMRKEFYKRFRELKKELECI